MTRILVPTLLLLALVTNTSAQNSHGISSDGRDFYIGYMPPLRQITNQTAESYYLLVCSYQDNNQVTISYFDASGAEYPGATKTIMKGRGVQVLLPKAQIAPSRPGEVLEYKAVHITSRYPVSVQCLDEGSNSGAAYQAIPTPALGKSYVIASWLDDPLRNNPGYPNLDSSSSEFMIVAAYNNTTVTFVPNSTTCGRVMGYKSGVNSDGNPHPTTIHMNRGQVYWVRSLSNDASNDISGSTVTANKPIAVLAGHERALLGDPSGYWTTLDNDIRNLMVQQMTPVEDWGSDYPSIPFMPAQTVARLLRVGQGNLYRLFTNDASNIAASRWQGPGSPVVLEYPLEVQAYESPAAECANIEDPVDFIVRSKDLSGNPKKMYAVMYDYFQGQHDFDGGGDTKHDPKGSSTILSNGGNQPLDETTYKMPTEMNLVPIDRWKTRAIFKIPQNSYYRGYQFVNIITNKDSLHHIFVTMNNTRTVTLDSLYILKRYTLPLHPELVGLTIKIAPSDYLMTGNTPFACYSYGRTETLYKDGWAYATSCGQLYGSRNEFNTPRASVKAYCDHWAVSLFDTLPNDEGIADVFTLNDSDGFYAKPGRESFNVSVSNTVGPFTPGDKTGAFTITITDPLKDAYAALYVVDRAGNDTVIELRRMAPSLLTSQSTLNFNRVLVGTQPCSQVVLKLPNAGDRPFDSIGTPFWLFRDKSNYGLDVSRQSSTFWWTSPSQFPKLFQWGDSIVLSICFNPTDTNNTQNHLDPKSPSQTGHSDAIIIPIGCGFDTISMFGKGVSPAIRTSAVDFGTVAVGDSACNTVLITNTGGAELILDSGWTIANSDFTFQDRGLLPDTISPGQTDTLRLCYHARQQGMVKSEINWHTNIPDEYLQSQKTQSLLIANSAAAVGPSIAAQSFGIDALSPNPASSQIAVMIHSVSRAELQIFDILGRNVLSQTSAGEGTREISLDLRQLAAGTYILRLSSDGEVDSRRFEIR